MKNILFITLFTISCFFVNAQNETKELEADARIYAFYPESKIKTLLKSEPNTIAYWNAILKNGYEISDAPSAKMEEVKRFREIEVEDIENINILALGLFPMKTEFLYFKIKNTNKILMVKSEAVIKNQNKLK